MKKTILRAAFAGLAISVTPALADPPSQDRGDRPCRDHAILQGGPGYRPPDADLCQQAKADLSAQGRALQNEGRTLQQQVAILAPDVKQKRLDAFRAKEQSLRGPRQRKDDHSRRFCPGRQAMEQQLGPILQQLVKERGSNLVLDKQAVVFASNNGFDITGEAINR